jgi:hypothetical protein
MRITTIAGRLAAILLLSVSATVAVEVKSDNDRSFDLSKLQSFRFALNRGATTTVLRDFDSSIDEMTGRLRRG